MSRSRLPGSYQFCVELGLSPQQTGLSLHRQLGSLAKSILELFDRYEIPATWAASGATLSLIRELRLPSSVRHELALLADSSWFDDNATRDTLRTNLRQGIQDATDRGIALSSLIASNVDVSSEREAIGGAGIGVIRTSGQFPPHLSFTRRSLRPCSRRGILHVAPSARFPGYGGFLGARDAAFAGKKTLLRAIRNGATEHLTINAAAMLDRPDAMVAALSRVAGYAARLRDAGRLRLETLSDAVDRSCPTNSAHPTRSILRPAA